MKRVIVLIFPLLVLTSCRSPRAERLSGSDFTMDANGRPELVTYVTQEEWERMSPQERERLHATVGAKVILPFSRSSADPEPVSQDQLDKAMKRGAPGVGK